MQRHKVNVPTEFYARLTRDVVKLAAEEGTGVDGRIISVLEGGYSDRALCTGVLSHLSGLSGSDPVAHTEKAFAGLNFEMGQRLGVDPLSPGPPSPYGFMPYDPLWWSQGRLEQLDAAMNSVPVPEEPKIQKPAGPQGNFASPTQSFIAKVVNTPTAQRSVSTMGMRNGVPVPRSSPPRPPTPPPPDVHWTVAAHELSKLLIPTDRQTKSCQWEDLAAEATKARKERQSLANSEGAQQPAMPEPANARMSLRTRKPPPKLLDSIEKDEVKKPAAKSNRRRTVPSTAASPVHKVCSCIMSYDYKLTINRLLPLQAQVKHPTRILVSQHKRLPGDLAPHLYPLLWQCLPLLGRHLLLIRRHHLLKGLVVL